MKKKLKNKDLLYKENILHHLLLMFVNVSFHKTLKKNQKNFFFVLYKIKHQILKKSGFFPMRKRINSLPMRKKYKMES